MTSLLRRVLHGLRLSISKDYMLQILNNKRINLIFDVGANSGQYARYIFDSGYKGRIISFEPLSSPHGRLLKNSKSNRNWIVSERCAIGEKDGKIKIHIAKNSGSSSALQMLKEHERADPESVYVGIENVKICKLDTIAQKYLNYNERILLKIDVQGYEDRVLKGATKILPKIIGIQVECSLVPLYKGEILFEPMFRKITNYGFELYDFIPGFRDKKTGRLLQVDLLFMKKENIKSRKV